MWKYGLCALLAWVLVAGACGGDDSGKALSEGCNINSDCASPLVCAFRKCHQACTTSRDCQLGQRCIASDKPNYVCQLADERGCSFNSDCPRSQTCGVDSQCRDQCAADRDCLKDQLCVGSTCADPAELRDGGLPVVAPEAGKVSSSGQPCLYTSECPEPLVCRDNVCANACATSLDCPSGTQCISSRCIAEGTKVIGPEGGVATTSSGRVKLTILPGSLKSPTAIVILPLDAWPAGALGPAFEIVPSGTVFNPPASLAFTYDPVDIGSIAPTDLRLGQAVGSKWTGLESTVDPATHTVSASIGHLSVYGMLGPAALADAAAQMDAAAPVDAVAPIDASMGGADASPDAGNGGLDAASGSDGALDQSVGTPDASSDDADTADSGGGADGSVVACATQVCTSGDGCCPYGCGNQADSDCSDTMWNTVNIGTVSYTNPNSSYCQTIGVYGITLSSNYSVTTCSPTAQGAGTGDPVITSIVDNLGNSYLDTPEDDCNGADSIVRQLEWTCVSAADETTMSCTHGFSGFRTVSTGNINRIDVTICASGPTRGGSAPLYIFYNAPVVPHLG